MNKSDLVKLVAERGGLSMKAAKEAVNVFFNTFVEAILQDERIEIRGFGSFALHSRPSRIGRNPKTGEAVAVPARYVPRFKPGKELRERVNSVAA